MTPVLRPERTVPVDHATGRPRLVLAPRPTPGGVDGRWWPRTRDLAVELPAPVAAVAQRFGAVDRVMLDPEAWDDRPRRATVGGRVVVLDWFGGGGRHAVELLGPHSTHVELLVIPPDTPLVVALACLSVQAPAAAEHDGADHREPLPATRRVAGGRIRPSTADRPARPTS